MGELERLLNQGRWSRPTDKMAVYTEIPRGARWGIRVTLEGKWAVVEAIEGEGCSWYRAPKEVQARVGPPTLLERLRGVTFLEKLRREVEAKRAYAAARNAGLPVPPGGEPQREGGGPEPAGGARRAP